MRKHNGSDDGDSETSDDVSGDGNNVSVSHRRIGGDASMELNDQAMKELMKSDNHDVGSNQHSSSDIASEQSDYSSKLDYDYEYSSTDTSDGLSLLLGGQKPLSKEQLARVQKVEKATKRVRDVIEKYGNAPLPPSLDPDDVSNKHGWEIDEDSAWADTSLAMEEIVSAREGLREAWKDNHKQAGIGGGMASASNKTQKVSTDEWWKSIKSLNTNHSDGNRTRSKDDVMNDGTGYEKPLSKEEQDEFQAVHMEWATNAFAEELEALRKGRLEKTLASSSKKQRKKGATTEEVGLDPTQYSFVIASKKGKGKNDEHDDEEADAAAAAKEIDVQVLADMIQSGCNFLSNTEKKMLLRARQRAMARKMDCDNDDSDAGLTLHERRKRELGFLV